MAKSSQMALSWIMKGHLDRSLIKATRSAAKQIDDVKKSADALGKRFSSLAGPAKKLKTAFVAGLAGAAPALMMIAKNTADSGNQFDKMSQKMGISAKKLSQLSHAANMSGVSTEQFGANILKLNQQIAAAATGNKSAQLAFKRAGVSIRDSAGKLKTADQVMLEMSNTFKKMPEGIYKSDLAMAVFGKSGADMIPLLRGGSESIKDLMNQADELGMTFSNEDAAASAEFCDNLDLLKKSAKGLTNTIGKQLVPVISPLLKSMANWISANRELISSKFAEFLEKFKASLPKIKAFLVGVFNGVVSFAKGVDTAVTAMGGWEPVLKNGAKLFATIQAIKFAKWVHGTAKAVIALGRSFKTLIPVVIRFGLALMANPIGLVITGIAALIAAGYLLYKNWDKVVKFLKGLWDGVKKYFTDKFSSITSAFDQGFIQGIMTLCEEFNPVSLIADAIDGIFKYFTSVSLIDEGKKLMKSFGDGLMNMWDSMKNGIISAVTGWIPDWLKSGVVSAGKVIGIIDETPKIDAHHANGAIVRHRQIAEIGEGGAEAVIPLTKPARGKQLLMQSAKIMGLNVKPVADSNAYAASKNLTNSHITQKINVVTPENNGFSLIDELTNGLAQTINNNNQKTSFSPSFNPVINITGVSNSDDIEKKLKKILDEQKRNFMKEFENYNYQRKRVGVF